MEDAKQVAIWGENAGLDAVHLSAKPSVRSVYAPAGWGLAHAGEVKNVVNIPIIAVGCLGIAEGDKAILDGKADFIAIGRPLIVDPDLPSKMMNDKQETVVPCIKCLRCIGRAFTGEEICCSVNVRAGRENEFQMDTAGKPKKVLVAGGGPAGLQAAIVAAGRGHQVWLYERSGSLGGQLKIGAKAPFKGLMASLLEYLVREVQELGVKIILDKAVTPSLIGEVAPDVVVVACGARPGIPHIAGIDQNNVVTYEDVLSGKVEVGKRVVLLGGGMVGAETAHLLADKGKMVTIVEALPEIAGKLPPFVRLPLLSILKERNVVMITSARVNEVTAEGMIITMEVGITQRIDADHIVVATGAVAENHLFEEAKATKTEVYLIGDAVEPRFVKEAMEEAFHVGRRI
ncbi:MAG: FAD-dependent oxidoreductase [Pseudomonadota bacterium]